MNEKSSPRKPRGSVSVSGATYARLTERCKRTGDSKAEVLEWLLADLPAVRAR